MRASFFAMVGVGILSASMASAQNQPTTIPTVVAQTSGFMIDLGMGRIQYFDGRTPPDWPGSLIPVGARVVGGSAVGDPSMFRTLSAVVEMPMTPDPRVVIGDLVAKAGFGVHIQDTQRRGGFLPTPEPTAMTQYCKGDSLVTFGAFDAAQRPGLMVMHMLVGGSARSLCDTPRRGSGPSFDPPVKIPELVPPPGTLNLGGGFCGGGSTGEMNSALRTTMSPDSLLQHYTALIVAGGWTADGKPAVSNGLAAQRFVSRQADGKWIATLVVMTNGELRDMRLLYSKEGER